MRPLAIGICVLIGAVTLFGRFWLDDVVNWWRLGVRVKWVKRAGTLLSLRFRNDGYFRAWLAGNPTARQGERAVQS